MKKLFVLVILITLLVPLSAEWKIGQIVDDFGDITGDEFAYYIVEDGTFSNSATKNSTAKVRISARITKEIFPSIFFKFETHNYGWDNPVNKFYPNSSSLLQFKNSNETVIKFNKKNSKNGVGWNSLYLDDAFSFYKFLKNDDTLKASLSCEDSKYNFTIGSEGFVDIINQLININSLDTDIKEWNVSTNDNYDINNKLVSIKKYFIIKDTIHTYGIEFHILGKGFSPKDSIFMHFRVYNFKEPIYIPDNSKFKGIVLRTGSDEIVIDNLYPTEYLTIGINYDIKPEEIYSLLEKGEYTEIELIPDGYHDSIKLSFKSSELKRYLTYKYSNKLRNDLQ